MDIRRITPEARDLPALDDTLRRWWAHGSAHELHPGDLGWHQRLGAEATAAALRVWSRGEEVLGIGLLDGPGLARVALAPGAGSDRELARSIAADATDPERDVLPEGPASLAVRGSEALPEALRERGWRTDEAWALLHCDLAQHPAGGGAAAAEQERSGVRTVVAGPEDTRAVGEVLASAFGMRTVPDPRRWQAMAAAPAARRARCLLARDRDGAPVATVTVWSAGPGLPGLVEPMGVHAEHRGRGLGRLITRAGLEALREMGASGAVVATPAANAAAVATYRSAGFARGADTHDLSRA
ncbi:acetyltransferase [Brachybacterium phenoliresistens]|uniref:Acetyltransferase n=1 Tax=Brachybacterium phenoliresistens TaxID=396014 RepID=Z9JU13_9MICO|nr:GNAT family N-acetyltransferase [Brachybacterium phenoliresistens]EWS81679.1 acetyltransferase [Brachybacterium phenoliresistens]